MLQKFLSFGYIQDLFFMTKRRVEGGGGGGGQGKGGKSATVCL